MAATQLFTTLQMGKESSYGTAVAATREWYPDGTGMLDVDNHMVLHGGNRGTRANIVHATTTGDTALINFRSNPELGVAYDELPFIFGQLDGGNSGSGAGADKTWTIAPSMTGANSQESYTIEVADDVQCYEVEGCKAPSFTLSASRDPGSLTQLEVNWQGRQPTKSTVTAVAANSAVKIPGQLWEVRFATAQSGLSGASDEANLLVSWSAAFDTGQRARRYQDGTTYIGQFVESMPQKADISLVVESTSTAVSQFYDKWRAQTVDFMQLKAIGPAIGSGTYIAQMQFAMLYTKVVPISEAEDGVNLYSVEATTVYDSTWTTWFAGSVVCSIASIT